MIYEYAIVDVEIRSPTFESDAEETMEHFDKLGGQGWELVSVNGGAAFFRRKKVHEIEEQKPRASFDDVVSLIEDVLAGAGYNAERAKRNYSDQVILFTSRPDGPKIRIFVTTDE
jgi:hypothetical protein